MLSSVHDNYDGSTSIRARKNAKAALIFGQREDSRFLVSPFSLFAINYYFAVKPKTRRVTCFKFLEAIHEKHRQRLQR